MCVVCYRHRGSPVIDTPEVRRLAAILATLPERMREGHRPWDVEDICIDNDLMWARWFENEYAYLADMRLISFEERLSVVALWEGHWEPSD